MSAFLILYIFLIIGFYEYLYALVLAKIVRQFIPSLDIGLWANYSLMDPTTLVITPPKYLFKPMMFRREVFLGKASVVSSNQN
jgi:hypothetical protein